MSCFTKVPLWNLIPLWRSMDVVPKEKLRRWELGSSLRTNYSFSISMLPDHAPCPIWQPSTKRGTWGESKSSVSRGNCQSHFPGRVHSSKPLPIPGEQSTSIPFYLILPVLSGNHQQLPQPWPHSSTADPTISCLGASGPFTVRQWYCFMEEGIQQWVNRHGIQWIFHTLIILRLLAEPKGEINI